MTLRPWLLGAVLLALAGCGVSAATAWPLPDNAANPPLIVDSDPDYEEALAAGSFRTRGWNTDFSRHTIPYDEISSGGVGRDGIPPIYNPVHETVDLASSWLSAAQPVVALDLDGEARAYPLAILTWHEIVNDPVAGVPVAVTFCPLCNSAVVFDRCLGGAVLDFGVSGNLRNSDLIMWDRQTESWWQQLTGEGIVGRMAGYRLKLLPSPIISWADFAAAHPEGSVLSRETGHSRSYGENPYSGYDRPGRSPFLFSGTPEPRLPPKERVAAVSVGDVHIAYPFEALERERVVHDRAGEQDIVVFFKSGTVSALDRTNIASSRDVGATGVFDPNIEGRELSFQADGDFFTDSETGSTWNILGQATAGPLQGRSLTPIIHGNHFWFAWAAFAPETRIHGHDP